MPRDVKKEAEGTAQSPLTSRPRKLLYGSSLTIAYAFLLFISVDYSEFLIFYLVCLCVSFLPLVGFLPSLWRTFVMLAVALLVRRCPYLC